MAKQKTEETTVVEKPKGEEPIDFDPPDPLDDKKQEEVKEEKQEEKKPTAKKPDRKDAKTSQKTEEKVEEKEFPDQIDGLDIFEKDEGEVKDEEKEEEKKDETVEEKKEEAEEDDILTIPEDEVKAVEDRKLEEKIGFNYTDLAKDAGLELEEGGRKEFVQAVKTAIEDAKTKVEFDLSKMSESEQQLIKFFRQGGKVDDILNPTKKFDEFLLKSPEDKAIYWLMNEKKITESEARSQMEDMKEDDQLSEYVSNIDQQVRSGRDKELQKILDESAQEYDQSSDRQKAEARKVKDALVKTVKDLDTFMDVKIPDKIKNHIAAEVETGRFGEVMDDPKAQVFGRLFMLFGDKILGQMREKIDASNHEGYKKGKNDVQKDLHNIKTHGADPGEATETTRNVENVSDPLEDFKHIDEDAITAG